MHKCREKLDTRDEFSNSFCLIYETIFNGKNKRELVECRPVFRGYHMPCQLVSRVVLLIIEQLIIFSCPIGVDDTFCCSKVERYSLLLKATEFFTAVPSSGS